MNSIYEISNELEDFLNSLPDTGELTEEDEARYAELTDNKDDKIKSTAYAYLNLKSKLEAIKNELDRITKLKKSVEGQMARVEKLIDFGMSLDKAESKDFGSLRVYYTKSTRTVVENEDLLPLEFKKVKYSPDLVKIKESLKAGWTMDGVYLEEQSNLQIK